MVHLCNSTTHKISFGVILMFLHRDVTRFTLLYMSRTLTIMIHVNHHDSFKHPAVVQSRPLLPRQVMPSALQD